MPREECGFGLPGILDTRSMDVVNFGLSRAAKTQICTLMNVFHSALKATLFLIVTLPGGF
jgi:hypothetical protein